MELPPPKDSASNGYLTSDLRHFNGDLEEVVIPLRLLRQHLPAWRGDALVAPQKRATSINQIHALRPQIRRPRHRRHTTDHLNRRLKLRLRRRRLKSDHIALPDNTILIYGIIGLLMICCSIIPCAKASSCFFLSISCFSCISRQIGSSSSLPSDPPPPDEEADDKASLNSLAP